VSYGGWASIQIEELATSDPAFPAQERVKEWVSKRNPDAARPLCVVRDAPSALLTMTYVIDGI
jgi:hypothetical protein